MNKWGKFLLSHAIGERIDAFDTIMLIRLEALMQIYVAYFFALCSMTVKLAYFTGVHSIYTRFFFCDLFMCVVAFFGYRISKDINTYLFGTIFVFFANALFNNILLYGFSGVPGVFTWAIAGLVVVTMFYDKTSAREVLLVYVALCAITWFLDVVYFSEKMLPPELFGLNFNVINAIFLAYLYFVPIRLFVPALFNEYMANQKLLKKADTEFARAEKAYVELEGTNESLVNALDNLRNAQAKLVLSEKMASLGQILAGIAHEINTPIGAIKASGTYIYSTVGDKVESTIKSIGALSATEKNYLNKIIQNIMVEKEAISTSERRAIKKVIRKMLEEKNIDDSLDLAGILVEMDLYTDKDMELIKELTTVPELKQLLDAAFVLTSIVKSADNIVAATDRVAKIIFALKSFAHFDFTNEMVQSNIADTIEIVLTLYRNQIKAGVTVVKNYEPIPDIMCFPDELNQLWTNIVHNALQAMDGKGTLTIGIQQVNNDICVSFSDTGLGMTKEVADNVFDPFFTTKPMGEGSGLGLGIARGIVEKHMGKIYFESEENKGTTFFVKLPVEQQYI